MSLTLAQTYTATGPNLTVSFLASGGTSPYIYSVRPNGAGGIINPVSGVYTAPATISEDPATISDVIQVRDSVGAIATASILVGTPLLLLCDIIQNQMGLDQGRVYLWDQKIMQPTDNGLYVAVSLVNCKTFGNNTTYVNGVANQALNVMASVDIDIISRGPAARDQKERVLMTLASTYSEQQQEAGSFHISRLTTGFINLSEIDGAAIPYRYKLSVTLQYSVINQTAIPYYNIFATPTVAVNP